MKLEIDTSKLPSDAELKAMFDAVPILERHQVADKTVRAGSTPIVRRARQLAPRGDRTGTSAKRAAKQAAEADWSTPLWKTVGRVIRKYSANAFAVVGPRHPQGRKAYFNTSPKGRRRKLWGKNPSVFSGANLSAIAPQIRNWIVQAFDETKPRQLAAMKAKLKTLMDEVWKRG